MSFDLHGRAVLVVEDDFYLADDTRQMLEEAGAEVLGPVSAANEALSLLEMLRPDYAVVDVNLGAGPSFGLASTLQARGIPFVFLTGYDLDIVPAEFKGVPCLQKPVDPEKVLVALSTLEIGVRNPPGR
ncbi:response regulator [Mesorhizobium sp.]|uniref:response regulator n=1 Tax=Mesorhizobium sp. TaxID=1871066 RepID=UPI000FE3B2F3|nr:response regulator [Mesorhizobium sp.]RWH73422.1 MAG: response regulator [Mesorhizobium sp.]RWL25641.1 MAG: response regulator [Mesorhizobium sp.]RWL36488.1 MAG: response regulator [Mesorhizobium sp.]RWL40752.1 MAG: response regulator [Mesorhizobium sp.]RWL54461.1 MAG: response regulator [Mesorhizobium sp.]